METLNKIENTTDALNLVPVDLGGGCSISKADAMFYLIKKYKIKNSIDIGIYRGRSLLPQALAHKLHTGGIVYGIDPYDNELVLEKDNLELKELIDAFVSENDFNIIYEEVVTLLKSTGLENNSRIIRSTSHDAIDFFKSEKITPGLIHIDGNHDKVLVENDVEEYTAILGDNGFIVMDDISWTPVKPALHLLSSKGFSLLFSKVNLLNDYAIYTNNQNMKQNKKLASQLYQFGQY